MLFSRIFVVLVVLVPLLLVALDRLRVDVAARLIAVYEQSGGWRPVPTC